MRGNVPATMKALVAYSAPITALSKPSRCRSADRTTSLSNRGLRHLRRRPKMPARRRHVLGRREPAQLGRAAFCSRP